MVAPAEIDLSWAPAGYPADGIGIWRKAGAGAWERIALVSPAATQFRDRSVAPGQTYAYRVRGHNYTGASAWSNEVSATTPGSCRTMTSWNMPSAPLR